MQQQKTASVSESIEVPDPHHEPSMSSLSVVLCTRFEKNDLFGNMSALYIVMEHTSEKRHRAHRHLFSPRERAYFTTPHSSRSVRIYAENIYFYYNHFPCSWVNRFLVTTPVRIDPDALASLTLTEINKSAKFELFPSF